MILKPSSMVLQISHTAHGVGNQGQNEGTIMNHLRTTHYKLGLICDQCYWLPYNDMSDTLCRHGCIDCTRLGHCLQREYSL